jgi:very-short-patch-repair endonuclease
VLDFACLERRVAIEVDGLAHGVGDGPARDARRDAYLSSRGFAVLRLPASDVLCNLEGVIIAIVDACDQRLPLHHSASLNGPPPRSGEVR